MTLETLQAAGLLRSSDTRVKLLGMGELKTKLTIAVDKASQSAIKAVRKRVVALPSLRLLRRNGVRRSHYNILP